MTVGQDVLGCNPPAGRIVEEAADTQRQMGGEEEKRHIQSWSVVVDVGEAQSTLQNWVAKVELVYLVVPADQWRGQQWQGRAYGPRSVRAAI